MHSAHRSCRVLGVVASVLLATSLSAQPQDTSDKSKHSKADKAAKAADLPAVLWHDPGDISSLDLANGEGGRDAAPSPDADYKFVREDMNGTSPKFYVDDAAGIRWLVKVGEEAKPETAATRFVWAMGYYTDKDYYLQQIHVTGMPKLHRQNASIGADGTVKDARLKRQDKSEKKIANWPWKQNPFTGTKELNGLRVMMAFLNNWDLKTANNKVYEEDKSERRFVVSDLGASFGKTGGVTKRSKGVLDDYENSKLVAHANANSVDFEMATRPFPLFAPFDPGNYAKRADVEGVVKHIPEADAKWIGQQLSKLTPEQIQDAFRAAGYAPDEVAAYAKAVTGRIATLNQLP